MLILKMATLKIAELRLEQCKTHGNRRMNVPLSIFVFHTQDVQSFRKGVLLKHINRTLNAKNLSKYTPMATQLSQYFCMRRFYPFIIILFK